MVYDSKQRHDFRHISAQKRYLQLSDSICLWYCPQHFPVHCKCDRIHELDLNKLFTVRLHWPSSPQESHRQGQSLYRMLFTEQNSRDDPFRRFASDKDTLCLNLGHNLSWSRSQHRRILSHHWVRNSRRSMSQDGPGHHVILRKMLTILPHKQLPHNGNLL